MLIELIDFPSCVAVAYINLGAALISSGRCQEAVAVLRQGSRLDGTGLKDRREHETAKVSALLQLGALYSDQGRLQRALATYREAAHSLPDHYPPQVIRLIYKPCYIYRETLPRNDLEFVISLISLTFKCKAGNYGVEEAICWLPTRWGLTNGLVSCKSFLAMRWGYTVQLCLHQKCNNHYCLAYSALYSF